MKLRNQHNARLFARFEKRNGLFREAWFSRGFSSHDASRGSAPKERRETPLRATAGSTFSPAVHRGSRADPRAPGPRDPRTNARVRKPTRFRSSPTSGVPTDERNLAPRHVHGLRRLVRLPRSACGDARRRGVPRGAQDGDQGRDHRLRPPPGFRPRRRRRRPRSASSPRRRFVRADPRRRGVGGVLRRVRRAPPHRLRRRVSRQGQGGRGVGAVHRGRGRKRARQSLRDHGRGGSRSGRARAAAPAAAAVRAAAAAVRAAARAAAAAARAATATSSSSSSSTTTTTKTSSLMMITTIITYI